MIDHSKFQEEIQGAYPAKGRSGLLTHDEAALAQTMSTMPHVQSVTDDDITALRMALQHAKFEDPYSESAIYYMLTGRRGLWIYARNEASFLVCLHPNVKDTVLVFPSFGGRIPDLKNEFLDKVGGKIAFRLARAPSDHAVDSSFREVKEDVLDWAYPVQIIFCKDTVERKGRNYQVVRQVMNKFSHQDVQSRAVDFEGDGQLLLDLASEWENHRQSYFRGYETQSGYFNRLVKLGRMDDSGLRWLLLYKDGMPRGFSIWEEGAQKTANLFASLVTVDSCSNLCTWLVARTCEQVIGNGGHSLCLGGSETEGMDRFKRKFAPGRSVSLKTLAPLPAAFK